VAFVTLHKHTHTHTRTHTLRWGWRQLHSQVARSWYGRER